MEDNKEKETETPNNTTNTSLDEHFKISHNGSNASTDSLAKGSNNAENKSSPHVELPKDNDNAENKTSPHIELPKDNQNTSSNTAPDNVHGTNNETKTGRRLLEENPQENNAQKDVPVATVENDEGLEADADSSFELLRDSDELADEYNYDYDDYVDETMWGDEEWNEAQHEASQSYVHVDSHILCTPVSLTCHELGYVLLD